MARDAYSLRIRNDEATIRASSAAGFAYGLTTLKQLAFSPQGTDVDVRDRPMYRWRGLHLDVSRHFFPVSVLERYIDLAAHYKLNVFHWHLTDDQAWRLEVKRYPALTATTSCRATSCAFYSQSDVGDVVRYARTRNVTVMPEIEMPAHASAALRAYPELRCGAENVFCPRPASLTFLENVLAEVIRLFPSRYIHVGGDEAPAAAQRYVLLHIEAFLQSHGRTMVTWDDALGSGISRDTVITSWNGEHRAVEAIAAGHEVVMVPDGPLYFNAYQGAGFQEPAAAPHMATLEQVYSYDPTPDGLSAEQRSHILGVEGAVWTEKIASAERLFQMTLPRALALSEIAWTAPRRKSWDGFLARLPAQLDWLKEHGYSFRMPSPIIKVVGGAARFRSIEHNVSGAAAFTASPTVNVQLSEPMNGVRIRYTLDGSQPTTTSFLYYRPLRVSLADAKSRTIVSAAFDKDGERSESSEVIVKRLSAAALSRESGARSWAALVSP